MKVPFASWLALATALPAYTSASALPRTTAAFSNLTVALIRTAPALWSEPLLSRVYTGVDINSTTDKGVALIKLGASKGANLVAFPEAWFPGYPKGNDEAWIVKWVANYIENSMVQGDSNWNKLVAAAKENHVFVALGFSERTSNAIYMAQALLGPTGEVIIHRHKLRPSGGERDFWSDGTEAGFQVANTSYGRIGLLECWEHFHPSMTFPMQAQLEAVHIGSWPYTPNPNNTEAQYWESEEVNMAAASMYAVNSGAWVLVPSVGRAAVFNPLGQEMLHIDADVSMIEEPMLYYSINTTAFTGAPYNINGEQSWGVLEQITNGWPKSVPKVIGNYTRHQVNTIASLLAL